MQELSAVETEEEGEAEAMTYCEHLARYGGMASCGEGLGVMVGTDIWYCPKGWVFLVLGEATASDVRKAIDHANRGRAAWPSKADK